MQNWNNIYSLFDPVAFSIFGFKIHWYGIMYVLALIVAVYSATYFLKHDKTIKISKKIFDSYIFWVEVGIILGARIGYVIFYDTHTAYYLTHPWQIFNPFVNGEFVGISGMSYHGGLIGFLIASYIYTKYKKINQYKIFDIAALAIPLGYIFGRIGNFLNQELIGRVTEVPWGIYVNNVLVHPSQLYEAILEGLVVFIIIYLYKSKKKFDGELILIYAFLYSIMRFIAELYREPDFQIGFIGIFSLGQILSFVIIILSVIIWTKKIIELKNTKPLKVKKQKYKQTKKK
ncbi:MAG: Prolipoprotein diacylglyceryl transferase (EC [uncultured Campylobacterales bacterium]|uniref:Phosphatidylglycerol--prolipoprotein diacylglyceryl transferase n=1 Tax=uncultured Campylobacterales bacterium TaxID=352960 RepID=A0A6S6SLE4_9BACT|nr:MAG: Prolipoprotein diacylglyceryl transferase (EC [uncultured Campylobacterales bacterium]